MNEKDIKNGNKLIAEFMGGIVQEDGTCNPYPNNLPHWSGVLYNFDTMKVGGYKYHESFDWLMPVVEKIEAMGYYTSISLTEDLHGFYVFKPHLSYKQTANDVLCYADFKYKNKIDAVYSGVISFIKWYNSQNNKP